MTVTRASETRGATIGSFASVSLDPPLVSFNVTHGTQLHAALDASDGFTVHLLADDQGDVATHFARPDLTAAEQAAGRRPDAGCAPGAGVRLGGSLGTLACTRRGAHPGRRPLGRHRPRDGARRRAATRARCSTTGSRYRGVGGEV